MTIPATAPAEAESPPPSFVTPETTRLLANAVDEAARLLRVDGAMVYLVDRDDGRLRSVVDAGIADPEARRLIRDLRLPLGVGLMGTAVASGEVVVTDDYPADTRFVHAPVADEVVSRTAIRSMAVAPLTIDGRAIGGLGAFSSEPDRFRAAEVGLLKALAGQAATAIALAQRIEAQRKSMEAQRALAGIAAAITALRDPSAVIQRTVDEALRLLGADAAMINPLESGGETLGLPLAYAPREEPLDDLPIRVGDGVSGRAIAESRVIRTDDYLSDPSFVHTPEADAYIARRGIRSLISAPLRTSDGGIGVLTVQSARPRAFAAADAEVLGLLADHAAIAISNARLYKQLQASEERYRFLVDNSPDLIWSCDAEGRFTFLSDSVERLTGYRPEEAVGQHWSTLTVPEFVPIVEESWRVMREDPAIQQRLRIEIPRKDGTRALVEIHAMPTTTVDGRFNGAHGSVRDLSERERLERDLRRQAAEIASRDERAHLARELHDSVTQALFSMGLETRTIELLLARDPAAARERLPILRDLQRDALGEMRSLIFELRPATLEEDGLVSALRAHCAAIRSRIGLTVLFESELEERLPIEVEEALFRVAQEALHNIVKHADAREVRVTLSGGNGAACLRIADDGRGFDPASVGDGHMGLAGMRTRVKNVGGVLTVRSSPGAGTTIEGTVGMLERTELEVAPT